MENVSNIVFLILGSIIGAGFASGQEIKIFFGNYGVYGLIGIVLSVLLIALIVNIYLKIILKTQSNTYTDLLNNIVKNNRVLKKVIINIINFFMLASFAVMCMGFSATLEEQLAIPKHIGGIVFACICYVTFIGSIDRIAKINIYIMPLLVAIIAIAGINTWQNSNIHFANKIDANLFFNSIIYASYNTLALLPVLVTIKKKIISKKQINFITVILFIFILIPAISLYFIVSKENISSSEILLANVTKKGGKLAKVTFSGVILCAIYTSAICSGYGFAKNISKTEKQYRFVIFLLCIVSIFISHFSFSGAIQIIYPLFGILGIIQIAYCIKLNKL